MHNVQYPSVKLQRVNTNNIAFCTSVWIALHCSHCSQNSWEFALDPTVVYCSSTASVPRTADLNQICALLTKIGTKNGTSGALNPSKLEFQSSKLNPSSAVWSSIPQSSKLNPSRLAPTSATGASTLHIAVQEMCTYLGQMHIFGHICICRYSVKPCDHIQTISLFQSRLETDGGEGAFLKYSLSN